MKDIDKKIRYYFVETGQILPLTKAEFQIRANYLKEMKDVKINTPFRKSTNGFDKSETYRILSADIKTNKVFISVEKEFNGEIWHTIRERTWLSIENSFHNNEYEYI
jgi:hypothetical protein